MGKKRHDVLFPSGFKSFTRGSIFILFRVTAHNPRSVSISLGHFRCRANFSLWHFTLCSMIHPRLYPSLVNPFLECTRDGFHVSDALCAQTRICSLKSLNIPWAREPFHEDGTLSRERRPIYGDATRRERTHAKPGFHTVGTTFQRSSVGLSNANGRVFYFTRYILHFTRDVVQKGQGRGRNEEKSCTNMVLSVFSFSLRFYLTRINLLDEQLQQRAHSNRINRADQRTLKLGQKVTAQLLNHPFPFILETCNSYGAYVR